MSLVQIYSTKIKIDGAGDKGISVGERSEFKGENIFIRNALIGIASKDSSEVIADSVSISQTKSGFATYQKRIWSIIYEYQLK